MEITSQIAANGRTPRDSREELRPGQVVSVNIKERISDREAIISIRGQEVRASFEGKIPQGDRALVEVRSNDAQTVTVRAMDDASVRVTGKGSVDSDIQQIAKQFGEKLTPDLRQALRVVVDSGTPLSKELVQQVRAFLDTRFDSGISGNPKQTEAMNRIDNKLDTLQAAVTKNINISQVHLQAIHEALHGSSLTEAIKGLKNELGNLPRENYLTNETLQSLTTLNTKDFLISVVTKKMAEVGNDFRDLRRDITKNMGNMVRVLETGVRGTEQVAQRMIEPTIQMLDKAILKSDMFLFTDMKTEKTLMKASADLEAAKAMLANGDRQAALQVVRQVQETISHLKWKPSADRVQRFVMEGQQQLEQLKQVGDRQSLSNQTVNPFVLNVDKDTMSGRQVFDFMRSLGLNHESEAAQRLVAEIASKDGIKSNIQGTQVANMFPTNKDMQAVQNSIMQLTKEAQELLQRPAIRDALIQALSQPLRQEVTNQQPSTQQQVATAQQASQANSQNQVVSQQQVAAQNLAAAQTQVQLLSQIALHRQMPIQSNVALQGQQTQTTTTEPVSINNLTQLLTHALQNVRHGNELQSSVQDLQRTIAGVERQGIPQEVLQRVSQLEQSVRDLGQFKQPNTNTNIDPRIIAERNVVQTTITKQMNELLTLVQRQTATQQPNQSQATNQSQQLQAQAQPANQLTQVLPGNQNNSMQQQQKATLMQSQPTNQMQQPAAQATQQPVVDPQRVIMNIQQLLTQISTASRQGGVSQTMMQDLQRMINNADRQGMPQPLIQKLDMLERSMQQTEQIQRTEQILNHFEPKNRNPQQLQLLLNQMQGEMGQSKNLKSMLMELIKQTMAQRGAAQVSAEQTLAQLTGQQLLSKGDSQSNNQTMFFQLPVAFQEQINNLKVFVNGKGKREKMDWENCSLYFLIETKKLGEIGIQVSAANRNLSVTVKNDTPGIKRFFDPLVERFTNQLNDVGYQVKGIKFTRLTEPEVKLANVSNPKQDAKQGDTVGYNQQKGFDLKI